MKDNKREIGENDNFSISIKEDTAENRKRVAGGKVEAVLFSINLDKKYVRNKSVQKMNYGNRENVVEEYVSYINQKIGFLLEHQELSGKVYYRLPDDERLLAVFGVYPIIYIKYIEDTDTDASAGDGSCFNMYEESKEDIAMHIIKEIFS